MNRETFFGEIEQHLLFRMKGIHSNYQNVIKIYIFRGYFILILWVVSYVDIKHGCAQHSANAILT